MASKKILSTLSDDHLARLAEWATDRGLLYKGKPNINEALRRTSAEGLGQPELADQVRLGNPLNLPPVEDLPGAE